MLSMRCVSGIFVSIFWVVLPSAAQVNISAAKEISDFVNYPRDLQVADMNGDGHKDIICREDWGGKIIWWQNDGTGQFLQRHVKEWQDLSYWCIALADANSDGKPDAWFRKEIDDVGDLYYVAYAQANGSYGDLTLIHPHHFDGRPDFPIMDLNGDGRLDLLGGDGKALIQSADATFTLIHNAATKEDEAAPAIGQFIPGKTERQLAQVGIMKPVLKDPPNSMVTYAMPGNDSRDVTQVTAVAGQAAGDLDTLWAVLEYHTLSPPLRKLARLSFNAQGQYQIEQEIVLPCGLVETLSNYRHGQDLRFFVSAEDAMLLVSVPADGSPAVVSPLAPFAGKNSAGYAVSSDVNGDGVKELVIASSDVGNTTGPYYARLYVMAMTPSGTPTSERLAVNNANLLGEIVWAGDFENDGDNDIIATGRYELSPLRGDHEIQLWKNQGNGNFVKQTLFDRQSRIKVIDVSDKNHDGRVDLLIDESTEVPNSEGYFWASRPKFLLFKPDNTIEEVPIADVTISANLSGSIVEYADMNADGVKDLVSQEKITFMRGDGTVLGDMPLLTGLNVSDFRLLDLDHDGDLDMYFTSNLFSGNFHYRSFYSLNSGNGVFQGLSLLGNSEPTPLPGDVDGDGFTDFHDDEGYLLSRPGVSLIRPAWQSELTGPGYSRDFYLDIDGDGDQDILNSHFYNNTSGTGDVGWLENRGNVLGMEPSRKIVAPNTWDPDHRQIAPDRFLEPSSAIMVDVDGDGMRDIVVSYGVNNKKLEWFKVTKPLVPTAYDQWMSGHGREGNLAGPYVDLDGDGQNNWSEFVFQSHPLQGDVNHENRPKLFVAGGSSRVVCRTRADVAGVMYQSSGDLQSWADRADAQMVAEPATGSVRWILEEPTGTSRKFYRLKFPEPMSPP